MTETSPATRPDTPGHRLFFALWPSEQVRTSLTRVVEATAAFRDAGRRVPPDTYHITLHFLGGWPALPADVIDAACRAAGRVRARPFHLVIDHAGSFGGARVGWLAPSGSSGLDAVWAALARSLDEAHVPRREHGGFAPHVTVLRNLRGCIGEVATTPVSWPVSDFVLVDSHAGHYRVLERWALDEA